MVRTAAGRFAILLLILQMLFLFPAAHAQENGKTVRVGWYESPFNTSDQFGRRSGYAYEYQHKISAYTGWNYEYVEGTWSELLTMLENGEIDLMSDVSYTEERTGDMLFSSMPMGTEDYYIFISGSNNEIRADDYRSLQGKTVGVTKDSIQEELFLDWAQKRRLQVELVELTGYDAEAMDLVRTGQLDAYVTLDIYNDPETLTPVCKVGSSDFFFVVNRERPDLLTELDAALNRIHDENKYYCQQLQDKYLDTSVSALYLTTEEKKWVADHGTIRVGYQDNYLAFCAQDKASGELTGALRDYLFHAGTCLENASLNFEAVAYPTAAAAMEALKNGEVDCMFPANLNENDSEKLGVLMTPVMMRTQMDAVVRASEQKEFLRQDEVRVCVNEGNTNYERFLVDHFPDWTVVYYPDTPTGLKAIADGEADCVILSNYRFNNIAKQCEKLHLATVYTGVDMDYYFAVRAGDSLLYSILSRVTCAVPYSAISADLTYYSTEDVKTTFGDMIRDNLFAVMSTIAVILLIILILLVRNIQAEKKVLAEESKISDLNRRVYFDALTSVRNRGAYDVNIHALQQSLNEDPGTRFAIGVFDCDNLKMINDQYGHDKGNIYLKAASQLICTVFQHSPVFRIGGDEFAVILQKEDFENREKLLERFRVLSDRISSGAQNRWEEVRVAVGIAVYDPDNDGSVNDTARRADKLMYEDKRRGKAARR
ncbi:MAG: transporter substrate-binding domain-containing protein [Oscillospiraceae bacterium]|nr:transporter substrate-binding domain-containing protein [Oscillospiraceae bacterium]